MFLKKIIVNGFKSFADRITLTLDQGITGVVGPNGSGKSNIIDAVRWVMGEQNAKNLRGEVATDIIFNGSERRKPLGMAEVSLVFDNADDSPFCPPEYRHEPEITLTRRLYADGQREYLIDRKPCRLKDIVNFFATTGLGGRSYSMIQQGQVDRILNAKPEDLREILEEAAGTLVYRKRKEEAEKKLEETNLNLSRVQDILTEVDRQLEVLKDQVAKAREWKENTDLLRQEEMSLFAHNYHYFLEKQAEIENTLTEEANKEVEYMTALAHYEAEAQKVQQAINEADPEIQSLQEKMTTLRETIARAESMVVNAKNDEARIIKRLQDIEREVLEDDVNLKVIEAQAESANAEVVKAKEIAAEIRAGMDALQEQVETIDESVQVYKNRFEEFEDEIKNLDRLVESNKARRESLLRDLAKTAKDKATQLERVSTLEQDLQQEELAATEIQKKVDEKKEGLAVELTQKHSLDVKVAERFTSLKDAALRRDTAKEKYFEVRAKYTSLQEIEPEASSISESLKILRDAISEQGGIESNIIKGLLTDFVVLSDEAQELSPKALSAFERWSERILVSSMKEFNDLVRVANSADIEALPISVLSIAEDINEKLVKAWADEYGAEPFLRYLSVTNSNIGGLNKLLSRIYHIPLLQLSNDVLADLPSGVIVFTAQGVSFSDRDEFVIGSRKTKGLLSRKRELEALAQELKTYERDLGRAQSEVDKLESNQNEDRQVLHEINSKLEHQNKDVLSVMSDLQTAQQKMTHKAELVAMARAQFDELSSLEQSFSAEIEEIEKTMNSLMSEKENLMAEYDGFREEAENIEERRAEILRQVQNKKLDLATSETKAQTLQNGFQQTKVQLEMLQTKLSRRYDERINLEQDLEKCKINFGEGQKGIERFVLEREQVDAEIAAKREQNAALYEEMKAIEEKLKECRLNQSQVQKLLSDRNLSLERIKMSMAGVVEQAKEKYQIEDLANFVFEREEDFNHESKTRKVQRLRAKIEAMGPINMVAIEEHEQLTERQGFITRQKGEIESSMTLLREAIQEIENTSKQRFIETFSAVNTEFTNLFPILFEGGEAQLVLTDTVNVLSAGVEVLVRLPGKKQQRLNLFSGGEKALTAISLIFALLKTKPTPFCFLDEVDAPLDEVNVARYNRVLQALASQFQFIVITHNRLTMEVLDTLYGITMQEPGVSTVVGVDMKEDLPEHLKKALTTPPPAKEENVSGIKRAGAEAGTPEVALNTTDDPLGMPEIPMSEEVSEMPAPIAAETEEGHGAVTDDVIPEREIEGGTSS